MLPYHGEELVLLASSVAMALAQGLSAEEVGVLAALMTAIGDNLAIIAIDREITERGL